MKLVVSFAFGMMWLACVAAAADDLDANLQALKDAQAKNDPALVKKLAVDLCAEADKVAASPAPASDDDKEEWTKRVAFAKDVKTNAEYTVYIMAAQGAPATTVDLMGALEDIDPHSQYLDQSYDRYLYALTQTGATAKVPVVAEKALANFPNNTDLLLVLTDSTFRQKQYDRALEYARRLLAAVNEHGKPEAMAAADWERKRTASLIQGYWTAGVVLGIKAQYVDADKNLRAALPLIQGNQAMLAPALFYLGIANYKVGMMTNSKAKVLEGAKFSEEASKIPGSLQQQAWRNWQTSKTDAGKLR